jgi:putative ABC transport system substrate-binding protein
MNRRDIVAGSAAVGICLRLPSLSWAQGRKVWRIGAIGILARPLSVPESYYGGLLEGLRELGYVEGRDFTIEWLFAEGHAERLQSLAAALVEAKVDIIVASSTSVIDAARGATGSIPIVMVFAADPIASGFVASLARPGGNITGLATQVFEVFPKQLELLKMAAPQTSKLALLLNKAPDFASTDRAKNMTAVAEKLGVTLSFVDVDLAHPEPSFAAMSQDGVDAMMALSNPLFILRKELAELAIRHGILYVPLTREEVIAGALLGYGQSLRGSYRQAAFYVDRIIKGDSPAKLPVQQPLKFDLVINLKTAKSLGLTIPESLLARADEVIE